MSSVTVQRFVKGGNSSIGKSLLKGIGQGLFGTAGAMFGGMIGSEIDNERNKAYYEYKCAQCGHTWKERVDQQNSQPKHSYQQASKYKSSGDGDMMTQNEKLVANAAMQAIGTTVNLDGSFAGLGERNKKKIIKLVTSRTGVEFTEDDIATFVTYRNIAQFLTDPYEAIVAAAASRAIGTSLRNLDGKFVNLGSKNKTEIISLITSRTGVRFTEDDIASFTTYRDIVEFLKNAPEDDELDEDSDPEWDALVEMWNDIDFDTVTSDADALEACSRKISARSRGEYEAYYRMMEAFLRAYFFYANFFSDDIKDYRLLHRAHDRITQAMDMEDDAQFDLIKKWIELQLVFELDIDEASEKLLATPASFTSDNFSTIKTTRTLFDLDALLSFYAKTYSQKAFVAAYFYEEENTDHVDYDRALQLLRKIDPSTLDDATKMQAHIEELTAKIAASAQAESNEEEPEKRNVLDKIKTSIQRGSRAQNQARAPQLTAAEQEYVETLKECLEDGEIQSRERRILERLRTSLGIDEARAQELEAALMPPQLTAAEQEYVDMYREYAAEGAITDKVRHRLDLFASALGITPERAQELETL